MDNTLYIAFRFPGQEKQILHLNETGEHHVEFVSFNSQLSLKFRAKLSLYDSTLLSDFPNTNLDIASMDKAMYRKAFDKMHHSITRGKIRKAILSRVIPKSHHIQSPAHVFEKLCAHYPNAYCYVAHLGKYGMWAGASPELLVQFNGDQARTTALAGTQEKGQEHLFGEKEYKEHAMVADEIDALSTKYSLTFKSEVYIHPAGQVSHLKQDFEFKLNKSQIDSFINDLHPTPAVCGLPRKQARHAILETEVHDRSFYTGFVRIDDKGQNHTTAFVNLRCMQLTNDNAFIYVGGGITAESDVEKEWLETEAKAQTMALVLEN